MKSPDRGLPARLAVAVPLAFLAACGTAAVALAAIAPANAKVTVATGGTKVPGAPNCPMFPADNIWNTDIS